jgi:hypothetical protein
MDKGIFEKTIQKYSQYSDYQKEWYIICSENTKIYHHCICGHNVKRITYIYNIITKHIMMVGTTCIKKCGINKHLKNGILVLTIKNILETKTYTTNLENVIVIQNFHTILNNSIETKFSEFQAKINYCILNNIDIDYYDIIAPFRRLLNDVCYLVTEYNYDFMILLKEIEQNVNALNTTVKHIIIDEIKEDILEESLSESSEEPVYHIIEKHTETETETEEHMLVEQICIDDKSVNIELDNIFFTITEEQYDIFICSYCDTSFFTQNDYYNHEKICIDNHSIIDSEPNDIRSESEIESKSDDFLYDNNEVIIYEKQSIVDRYCNRSITDLKCTFCIEHINSYCYCHMRLRLYKLSLGIHEFKKDVADFSMKVSTLLQETRALTYNYYYK